MVFAGALAEFYVFSLGCGWQDCFNGTLAMAMWMFGNATGYELRRSALDGMDVT